MDVIAIYGIWFVALAGVFGFYMTWGIGANDVANAMGTAPDIMDYNIILEIDGPPAQGMTWDEFGTEAGSTNVFTGRSTFRDEPHRNASLCDA